MKISDGTLTIRSAELEDAEQLAAWWNDGSVMAHAGFPNGLGTTAEVTRNMLKRNVTDLSQNLIIEETDVPIGEMNYRVSDHAAEVGIKVCNPEYQNGGRGTRLMRLLISYLFDNEDLNQLHRIDRIILDTNMKNKRAQHVYEKIGFRQIAVNENSWRDQLGNWQSSVDYELTRKDWAPLAI
ncbi:MAG TPA: GNAT family protein [Bellilinea sp.]|nr:GNAT family protein [Bellilinea sp.]